MQNQELEPSQTCNNYQRPTGVMGGPCLNCGRPQPDHAASHRPSEAGAALVSQQLTAWAARLVRLVCFIDLDRNPEENVAEPIRRIALEMRDAALRPALPATGTDAEVIASIRAELWDALDRPYPGEHRTLVSMLKQLRAERDAARENRRGEFDLRMEAEAKLRAATGTAPADICLSALLQVVDEDTGLTGATGPTGLTGSAALDYARLLELCDQFDVTDTDILKHRLEDWERWHKDVVSLSVENDYLRAKLRAATGTALDVELTDSMIMQMLGEAHAAERRAGEDALTIGCTPQQVHDIELAARCETIRSYLYQAGILNAERAATGTGAWQPMETAPRDGTEVLVTNGTLCRVCKWLDKSILGSGWFCELADGAGGFLYGINGWQPLPPAPSTERG